MKEKAKEGYRVLDMCGFCIRDFKNCGADYILSKEIKRLNGSPVQSHSVIACNKYESPVETINRQNY